MWDLISIKKACEELKISRVTLYKKLKENHIKPIKKKWNNSYITTIDFTLIEKPLEPKNQLLENLINDDSVNFYKTQFELLTAKNDELTKENGNLKLEIWRWQWRAENFQQQLFLLQNTTPQHQEFYDFSKNSKKWFFNFLKNFFNRS